MDLLLRLSAEPGAVVKRETLIEDVWPRRMVNDEVLSRAVAELRTALGDDVKSPRYIETLPKIGYRLVAAVEEVDVVAAREPTAIEQAVAPSRRRGLMLAAIVALVAIGAIVAWRMAPVSQAPNDLAQQLVTARPFSSDPGLELGPRFSNDGQLVAHALAFEGGSRIVVQARDSTPRGAIGGADGLTRLSPVFQADGRRLVFWRAGNGSCAIVEWEIGAAREGRELVDCAARPRARFDLSRDGRHLVYAAPSRTEVPAGLHVLDLQTGTRVTLTTPEPGAGEDLLPRFSPDGRRVAFFRGNESHRELWVLEREAPAKARAVVKLDGLSYGVAWLGEEKLLASADWFGFRALNVVDLATGQARLAGARGARFPDVAADGAIVFENAAYTATVWRVALEGKAPAVAMWPSTRYTNQPEYSPDGQRLAFASNRDGVDGIFVAAISESPQRIAGDESHRYLRPHWTADGKGVHAIRLTVADDGRSLQEGVRIAADGSGLEALASLGKAVTDVRETRDGKWLLWGEAAGHATRLLRAPIGRPSQVERLPWPVAAHFQVNGDRVALAQPQMAVLTLCRLSDLACEPLGMEVSANDLYHWTLGEKSLFVRDGESVARYDLATRSRVQSIVAFPSGGGTSLAISPGERELAFIREEGPAIDLMLALRRP
jgi:hypothetical protein